LSSPPRKGVLAVLAHYAKDENEKKHLLELSDETKQQPYNEWIRDAHRSIIDILLHFKSVEIPFDHFLEIIPRLAPRYYSISSSSKAFPGYVHITCVVVNFENGAKRFHRGVCSNWLAQQIPAQSNADNNNSSSPSEEQFPIVPVFVHKSQFHLPSSVSTPILMVGPGTGLAPFRGFIQERQILRKQQQTGSHGDNVLFFGCRSSEIDFIYKEELEVAQNEQHIKLITAFSRDQTHKVYVQHKMREHSAQVWKVLEEGAYFYVCGDARQMAKDVHEALEHIIVTEGKKTKEEAAQFIEKLQKSGKYLSDTWF